MRSAGSMQQARPSLSLYEASLSAASSGLVVMPMPFRKTTVILGAHLSHNQKNSTLRDSFLIVRPDFTPGSFTPCN